MQIRLTAVGLALLCSFAHADPIDDLIHAEMQQRHVLGISIAIIDGGKIVKAAGYGVTEAGGSVAVTAATLFQAGSVSKAVSATAALQLVEQGKLGLDDDINMKLVSWKVPENEFTKDKKVTLRGLLSHSAGMTVHGFPGYAVDAPMPTLIQVLNGEKPANTAAIRVEAVPGSAWNYSGGGYTIMQQAMIDVSGKPFAQLMQSAVLTPLGMQESTYSQPLPEAMAARAASGNLADRSKVPGHWHVYPEMAAAGLWTTPSDLARFGIGMQQSLAGVANPVISRDMTRQMLTVQKGDDGLGVFLKGSGKSLEFSHNGRDEGFDSVMRVTAETGQGAIIMINTNDNSRMTARIMNAIATQYHWPSAADHATSLSQARTKLSPKALAAYAGYYDMGNGGPLILASDHGHIVAMAGGFPDDAFVPVGASHFVSTDGELDLAFARDASGKPNALVMKEGEHVSPMPRIGPLAHTLMHQQDPHPERTGKLMTAFAALAQGGDAVSHSDFLADGVKKALGTAELHEFDQIKTLAYLAERKIDGHGFPRFGTSVAKVVFYKINDKPSDKFLIAYLTADALLADADIVDDLGH